MDSSCFSKLTPIIAGCGTPSFWWALHGLLADAVPQSMIGVFLYRGCEPPTRLYDSEGAERDGVHSVLANVGYLISPYYHKLIRPRAAVSFYRLSDVAPDDFLESEYYHVYYAKKGVSDEGMYHVPIDDERTVVIMVERGRAIPAFDDAEGVRLLSMTPIVDALLRNHFKLLSGQAVDPAPQTRFGFRSMAACFGAEMLSSRERDVALLILRGHSTKSAARELGIAPETERVHRRRLYGKLGINSHSELFWLFFEATEFFDPSHGGDPLAAYLRTHGPPKQHVSRADLAPVSAASDRHVISRLHAGLAP